VKRWFKRIFTTLVSGGIAGALVYAFMPRPVPIDVGKVTRGGLQVAVEEDGKTRVRERYVVSSPLAGRLQRLRWKAGDVITRSQPLAVIEPTDPALLDARSVAQAEARVKAAQAAVEQAAANQDRIRVMLDHAEGELARAEQLKQKNALSTQDLEEKQMLRRIRGDEYRQARHAEDVARFELELAKAALLRARPVDSGRQELMHFEIPAPPLSGSGRMFYVLRVLQESETVVAPGTPILEIGDPSDLEIEVDVLSSDAVKIRPGARVLLEQWGGETPLEARVRLVEPSGFLKISALVVEEQRVNVIADFASPEQVPDTLRDGFRVEARIIVWEAEDVLKVPNSALFRRNEGWAVFRVIDGRAALRSVEIGRRNGLDAEVKSGLAEWDEVVVHPSDKINDGVQVVPR
jgi:HlyD family secretion protein